MPPFIYWTQRELTIVLEAVNEKNYKTVAGLSGLENRLRDEGFKRSPGGIGIKIERETGKNPEDWNSKRVKPYIKEMKRLSYQNNKNTVNKRRRDRYQNEGGREAQSKWYEEGGGREYHQKYNKRKKREREKAKTKQNKNKVVPKKSTWHSRYRLQHIEEERRTQKANRDKNRGRWIGFGQFLTERLEDNYVNENYTDVARLFGMHKTQLAHIRAGNRRPNNEFLRWVSDRYSVPYQTLESLVINGDEAVKATS
jgi:hypothetical protein